MPSEMQYKKIEMIASIVQSTAIVLGVGFAVYEFVLKDRQQKKDIVEFTLQQTSMVKSSEYILARKRLVYWGDLVQTEQVGGETSDRVRSAINSSLDKDTKALQYFYNVIDSCISTKHCDRNLALKIICNNANSDLDVVDDMEWRVGNRFMPGDFRALRGVSKKCKVNG